MSNLKFVETHNLVAFLEKPDESEGFEQIVDLLNAHTIKYVLTVNPTIYTSCIEQFWATAKVKTINEEKQLQALVDKKKVIITESTIRRDLQLEDVDGMHSHEEMGKGSKIPTDPHHTLTITQPSTSQPQKKQPRRKQRKDTEVPRPSGPIEHITDETENVESVPTHSNDPLLSGEDSIKLNELIELCTTLQSRVLALETTKTIQALEIDSLKRRVKKLEKKKRSRTHRLKRLYKVGLSVKVISSDDEGLDDHKDASKQGRIIDNIDADEGVTLVNETQGRNDEEMFDRGILDGEEVFAEQDMAEKEVSAADLVTTAGEVVTTISTAATITFEEFTLAQALVEIKTSNPKAKGIVKDKGKGKMVEPEPMKKISKKEQIRLDKEVARNLQAQLQAEEEERIEREKQDANVTLIEE
ncbi:hypothetical protein Tco_1450028 [Tanacetum coccineum]